MFGPLEFCCMRSWHLARCLTQVTPLSTLSPCKWSSEHRLKKSNIINVAIKVSEHLHSNSWMQKSLVRPVIMSLCGCSSHDELPGGAEDSPGLQDAMPSQLPQSHVWHHDGVLEGERTGPAHIWDPAVEAGGLLRPGCDLIWRCGPLLALARWSGCKMSEERNKLTWIQTWTYTDIFYDVTD